MNQPKPRIRIKLVSPIDVFASAYIGGSVRRDGEDYWEAELTTMSNLGQVRIIRFTSCDRQKAVNKAYKTLYQLNIDSWFGQFYAQQEERWKHLLHIEKARSRFDEGMFKVSSGEYTREDFISLWEHRDALYAGAKVNNEAKHVKEVNQPWKWWHWFYRPENK